MKKALLTLVMVVVSSTAFASNAACPHKSKSSLLPKKSFSHLLQSNSSAVEVRSAQGVK